MLTKKQRDLLILIHDHVSKGEVAPSFEEMKNAIGLKSKSGIHRLIGALEERGFIRRLPNRARAIEILKLPDGYEKQPSNIMQSSSSSVSSNDNIIEVPLCGKIAAALMFRLFFV